MNFRVQSNIKQKITRVQANLRALPQQIGNLSQEIVDKSEAPILSALSFTPAPPNRKIEWTSEKQRKAYFATDGFGKGIPYRRTGTPPRGWRVFGIKTSNGATIIVQNEWNAAKYLIGTFVNESPQQRFHAITGWTGARNQRQEVIDILLRTAREVVSQQVTQLIFD